MATQYTSILKLALPVQGELSGTWGDVVNDNITSMVEEAIAGRAVINTWTANSHTLTTADGTTSESRAAILTLTDTGTALTGAGTVICPAASKIYIVENGTGQTITVKTSSGTGIAVPNTKNMVVFCDGTNVEEGITNINSLTLNGDGATVSSIKDEDNMASNSATALATQQSIKAYVDSQVGTVDTLAEVLANGNTTGGTNIAFGDNDKAIFGAGSDLQIYHSGSHSVIEDSGTGNLFIKGTNLSLRDADGNDYITMVDGGSGGTVSLLHLGSTKLATTSTGIDVTGVITTDGMTTSADINFGDNDKAVFGAGSDLQIYHDGTHSYIKDAGTGNLNILASTSINLLNGDSSDYMARFNDNGSNQFFYDGSQKLVTTSTGIDVTGTVVADGLEIEAATPVLEIDSTTSANLATLQFATSGTVDSKITHQASTGVMTIDSGRNASWGGKIDFVTDTNTRMRISNNGDISFYEDTGTTAKLFWDASAESLGIGQGVFSGTQALNLKGEGIAIKNDKSGSNNNWSLIRNTGTASTSNISFVTGAGEALVLAHDTNVGIGTDSPNSYSNLKTLTINGTNGSVVDFETNGTLSGEIFSESNSLKIDAVGSSGVLKLLTNSAERMQIASNGNVGIGTSSPSKTLDIEGNIRAKNTAGSSGAEIDITSGGTWRFRSNPTTGTNSYGLDIVKGSAGTDVKMSINSSGNVGIGTSSPAATLDVVKTGAGIQDTLQLRNAQTLAAGVGSSLGFGDSGGARLAYIAGAATGANNDNGYLSFYTRASDSLAERMRIRSDGNVLIGKTADDNTTAGHRFHANGFASHAVTSDSMYLNRLSTDGAVLTLAKDGSTVGSIQARGGDIVIGTGDTGIRFNDASNALQPHHATDVIDATIDLGLSSHRFKDLHLSGSAYVATSIGIGTSSPSANLEITQSGNNVGLLVAGGGYNYTAKFESSDAEANIIIEDSNSTNDGNMIGVVTNDMYFITNTSERMRIDASGNLMVGKTDTSIATQGAFFGPNYSHITSTNDTPLALSRKSSDGTILDIRKDGTTVGSIFNSGTTMGIGSLDTGVLLANNIDAILPWNASTNAERDNAIDLGRSAGRFKDLYLSGGVQFGTTGAAAQNLDDYEEGTFTPTITSGTVTYTAQRGRYTKIGRVVHIHAFVQIASISGSSGTAIISGLPFTAKNDSNYSALASKTNGFNWGGSATMITFQVIPNTATIGAVGSGNNIAFNDVNSSGLTANDWIACTGHYVTDS